MDGEKLPDIREYRNLLGTYVLLRASLNVPIESGNVRDDFRITRALETIEYLAKAGARVVVIAHIGREAHETLRPVYELLRSKMNIAWCEETIGDAATRARNMLQNGDVLLLENLRSVRGEKENDPVFANELAALGDVYVNDAFSDSHREHASIVGVPKLLPSYFGLSFLREYEALCTARVPEKPALVILGGAKFETKLPLVEQFLSTYDQVFIGGALAHDIWKANGYEIGASLTSDIDMRGSEIIHAPNLLLPIDVVVRRDDEKLVTTPTSVTARDVILDAGPKTIEMLKEHIERANTILWNGPLGNYEEGFIEATEQTAKYVADARGRSIVGGGDTIAAVRTDGRTDQFGFISTAGGAMLSFLEHGSLPAIDAVIERN